LEDLREEKLTDWVVKLQAFSRGCLGRRSLQKLKVIMRPNLTLQASKLDLVSTFLLVRFQLVWEDCLQVVQLHEKLRFVILILCDILLPFLFGISISE